jgi:hypothetical protein
MKKEPSRITIAAKGLILQVPSDRRTKFLKEAIAVVFADHELYNQIMKRITGLTIENFLLPGQIVVDAETRQQPQTESPKGLPQEFAKAAPVARHAPEQKPATQSSVGVEERACPALAGKGRDVLIKHPFGDEPEG